MIFLSIGKGWFLKAIDNFRLSRTKRLISSLTFRRYNGDNNTHAMSISYIINRIFCMHNIRNFFVKRLINDIARKGNVLKTIVPTVLVAGIAVSCSSNRQNETTRVDACPALIIPTEVANVTRYDGRDNGLANIVYDAKIVPTNISCDSQKNEVIANITLRFAVQQGKAYNSKDKTSLSYFVAVVDDNDNVLSRQILELQVVFAKNKEFLGIEDQIEQRFSMAESKLPRSYRVVIGFVPNSVELQRLGL